MVAGGLPGTVVETVIVFQSPPGTVVETVVF